MNRSLIGKSLAKKYFSLKTLNHRLLFYKFNDSENRPPVITETDVVNKRLKMTASQMMSFVLNFGLIVGDLITNKEDPFWQLYKYLRQILCIALMDNIDDSVVNDLELLITEYHKSFIDLIGPLSPKHHLITHYPDIMRNLGPVVNMWSMRCEAKHYIFKKYSTATVNRINFCYSLAVQHQLIQSDYFLQKKTFSPAQISYVKYRSKISTFESKINFDRQMHQQIKSVSIGKSSFEFQTVVLILTEAKVPHFGRVTKVYISDCRNEVIAKSDFVLQLQLMKTLCFNEHYQAFEVEN